MNTRKMLMVVAAAMVCATCCAKEDYKDPQKFAEKYVREDVERKYPGEVFNPILQYKGFELVNIHSEMRETLSGANSRIVCEFRVVPERGVEYYRRARDVRWYDYGHMGLVYDVATPQLTKERIADINRRVKDFAQRRPLLVEKADITITSKPNHARDTIYVYRTRNEDGIFVPMRAAGAGSVFRYEGVGGWYNTNELFTARTVKRLGGFEASSAEGKAAHLAHSNACEAVRLKIKALNEAVAAFNSVTNRHGWNQSFAETRLAELKKERVVPLETELSELEKTLKDQAFAAKKKIREIKNRVGSIAREKKSLEKSLSRLASIRSSAERSIEQLKKQPANSRNASRAAQKLQKQEANLADIIKKQEEATAQLQALDAQEAEVQTAEQSAQTDADKEQSATQAKIDALKAKIAEATKVVEGVVQADASARLEKLANEIQTLVNELEKLP